MKYISITLILMYASITIDAQNNSNAIVGKWVVLPKENFIVEVYKAANEYKARLVWFKDTDDKSKPMAMRMDEKNPEPGLRNRKLLGLVVLNNMIYNPNANRWENGQIYDAKSGKIWSSSAWIDDDGKLEVRGFWHYEFLGRNMTFKRYDVSTAFNNKK